MRKLTVFLSSLAALALVTAVAVAGPGTAIIKCLAIGGAFKLSGEIPTAAEGLDLTFSDRHGRTRFQAEAGYIADVKQEIAEGRFEFDIAGEMGMTLASVHRTMRATVRENETKASFDAVLTGAPKTASLDLKHPKLRMRCEYSYPG
ncbi:MAG: hypothetical protein WBF87_00690 [Mesorhizobium sp.]